MDRFDSKAEGKGLGKAGKTTDEGLNWQITDKETRKEWLMIGKSEKSRKVQGFMRQRYFRFSDKEKIRFSRRFEKWRFQVLYEVG